MLVRMASFITCYPPLRDVGRIAVVVERHNLLLQQPVERLAVHLVLGIPIAILDLAKGPAIGRPAAVSRVVRLGPPTIQHAQVGHPVHGRLHATGAAGFIGTAGIVQPHVHPLHQEAGHVQTIVLQEGDAPAEFRILCVLVNLLDEMLAAPVGRVGLAGKDDLDRPALGVEDPLQALRVPKDEGRSLVGGKPAGETDGQCLRVEQGTRGQNLPGAHLPFTPPLSRARVYERQQLCFELLVRGPQNLVRDLVQPLPESWIVVPFNSQSSPRYSAKRSFSDVEIQLGTWAPLVMALMGTSSTGALRPDRLPHPSARPRHGAG